MATGRATLTVLPPNSLCSRSLVLVSAQAPESPVSMEIRSKLILEDTALSAGVMPNVDRRSIPGDTGRDSTYQSNVVQSR
jgi:hypothetical protein